MNNPPLHGGGGGGFDRDRERDRSEMDEPNGPRPLQRQQGDMPPREREQMERQQHPEPYPSGTPRHGNTSSLTLHHPVASRPGAMSPGGLLANHANPGGPMSLGNPAGTGAAFGGSLHTDSNQPLQHVTQTTPNNNQHAPHQMFMSMAPRNSMPPNGAAAPPAGPGNVFGGPLPQEGSRSLQQFPLGGSGANGPPGPPGQGGMAQGQQPILNDALSYLDQVKVQFHEQPDVYNRFLDIMKDFKSQTIDTPGVIGRVSELFAGHPTLIQGFNTFLPPGYRIECGHGNDPNTIRVTTPMGTTVQSISGSGRANQFSSAPPAPPGPAQPHVNQSTENWMLGQLESPEMKYNTPAQNGRVGPPHDPQQGASLEPQGSAQRSGGPPAQSGGSANHVPVPRNAHTPTPAATPASANGNSAQSQQNMEKRGPVEFNHAISYVNKIKNRFQDRPEIYKQFLEILQTYQREQKPIQDVYGQVTTLFHSAPDLLEDFKQFLPESAAQARTNAMARVAEESGVLGIIANTPQPANRDGQKMPPVGNFAPPASTGKENKKRPRPDKNMSSATTLVAETPSVGNRGVAPAGNSNKRLKLSQKPAPADGTAVEPDLVPILPRPMTPTSINISGMDEQTFFEKCKKFLNNKTASNEFLKLCNLHTQKLVDDEALMRHAVQFIGGNHELLAYFQKFIGLENPEEARANLIALMAGKISLSNCRGYGPSYRLLPKRERQKECSGRDELCRSVLNDEWASHPTWASEDSGFVAHRKNAYEEGLHRIEEERHDYDFYIEANQKCIQLLEPIAQQMLSLPPAEQPSFKMPPGLGGQSTSIYKRVLKKIYGLERGAEVVNDLFTHPCAVIPVVLARLKQKDEEWRFTQREWEKTWQAQTEVMHLKSLDHMGIQVKQNDKRNLSAKHLVDLIKTKHEEQRRARLTKAKVPRHQFLFSFTDNDLILDLLRFAVLYALNNGQHSAAEKERIIEFLEKFIPHFFDIPDDKVEERLGDIDRDSGEEEAEEATPTELTNGRSSRRNGKKSDHLRRAVIDPGRNGSKSRGHKEDSAKPESKETTPDQGSANEEEMGEAPEDGGLSEVSNERWLPTVPRATIVDGDNQALLDEDGELRADGFFPRPWYNFFCNQTIYMFFSILHTLYKRMKAVKESKETVFQEIAREKAAKPAKDLGICSESMNYFDGVEPEKFWEKTTELVEDYINGDIDEHRYQEVLRHYYLKNGWQLYTIQDLFKTICRLSLVCSSTDSKEKTPELIRQFQASRQQEETSYQTEISARKYAEKCIKDGEMFVVCWFPGRSEAAVRWLQKDETTFYMDELELRERWQYYISSYMRVEPTEGISRSRLQKSLLFRNLPSNDAASDDGDIPKPISVGEGLVLRICLNSAKIVYEEGTSEGFRYNPGPGTEEEESKKADRHKVVRAYQKQKMRERMVMNNAWMKDLSQDDVQSANEGYLKWVKESVAPSGRDDEDDVIADAAAR